MDSREGQVHAVLRRHQTNSVWHYTLARFLPSIFAEGGILPRSELVRRGVPFHDEHFWGTPGKEEELKDYVCCSFLPSWGMMTHERQDLALIRLDVSIVCHRPTCFCPGNAARKDFPAHKIKTWTEPDDLESLYTNRTSYTTVSQAELLVWGGIPISYFREIYFWDKASKDVSFPLIQTIISRRDYIHPLPQRIAIKIDPSRFPGGWQPERVQWPEV